MSFAERRIYLDHNATAPLLDAARDALVRALDLVGNPSSVHSEGRKARGLVEAARRDVAALVGADAEAVVFTASATEACTTCLTPSWIRGGREIEVAALAVLDTDHPAIRDGGRFSPGCVTRLDVGGDGIVDLSALDRWVEGLAGRVGMLAMSFANGETGVIQPLAAIRERVAGRDVILVLDVVQAAGRVPLDIAAFGADAMVLSGHKIGAAKGVGALVLAGDRLRPFRLVPGGGQEKGLRSGTEAVPAIASFGAAANIAARLAAGFDAGMAIRRDGLLERLRRAGCGVVVLGEGAERLANTLALSLPALKAETAQIALDLEGFAVSAGSACSSGKVGPSHVLAAMARGGLDADPALGLLRVSFGPEASEADLDAFAAVFARVVRRAQDAETAWRAA